ncbi:hypothetical protein MKEN_00444400 [Mycena kentingensis (nom. inval.)]|nr:hypothetical protein MKEN_00444400 [Mycena kentingensis (nom. inval.)]
MRPIQLVYIALAAAAVSAAPIPDSPAAPADTPSADFSSPAGSLDLDTDNYDLDSLGLDDEMVALPPVNEVFAIMAAATLTEPTATNSIHQGLGIASSPVVSPSQGIVPTSDQETAASHGPSPLAHRLIFVSVVLLSMVAVIIAVYAVSYHRHKLRMNKLDGVASLKRESKAKEKGIHGRCSVMDISSRNFPRSKFSVTSSDYPVSVRISYASSQASSSSSSSDNDSEARASDIDTDSMDEYYREQDVYEREQERGRMMNAAYFFVLRSSSMAASPPRHSRIGSAPVFGIPRFDLRRDHSRRSQSVSGGNRSS